MGSLHLHTLANLGPGSWSTLWGQSVESISLITNDDHASYENGSLIIYPKIHFRE